MRTGIMLVNKKSLASKLSIRKGDKVIIECAEEFGGFFVRPIDNVWPDGIKRGDDDTLFVFPNDFDYDK